MASYPLSIVSGKLRVARTNGRLIIIINNYGRATSMFSTSFFMHLNTSLSRQGRNSTIQSECFISNYFANPYYRDRSLHSQNTPRTQYHYRHFYFFCNQYSIEDWGRFYYRIYWGVYWRFRGCTFHPVKFCRLAHPYIQAIAYQIIWLIMARMVGPPHQS